MYCKLMSGTYSLDMNMNVLQGFKNQKVKIFHYKNID